MGNPLDWLRQRLGPLRTALPDSTVAWSARDPKPFRAFANTDSTFSLAVRSHGAQTLLDGTVNAAATAAAVSGSTMPCQAVLLQNDPSNTTGNDIYVGNATTQSLRLRPADAELIPIDDVAKLYVKAVAGTPRVNWHAT